MPHTGFDRALWACLVKSNTGPNRGHELGTTYTIGCSKNAGKNFRILFLFGMNTQGPWIEQLVNLGFLTEKSCVFGTPYITTLIQELPRNRMVSLRADFPAQSPVKSPLLHKLLP